MSSDIMLKRIESLELSREINDLAVKYPEYKDVIHLTIQNPVDVQIELIRTEKYPLVVRGIKEMEEELTHLQNHLFSCFYRKRRRYLHEKITNFKTMRGLLMRLVNTLNYLNVHDPDVNRSM